MKTYLINLDRDSDRMQHMSSTLKELDIAFERVSAVEGKLLPDDFYKEFCKKIQRSDWIKGGQLGCFLSHFKAWELVANGSDDLALILEDDMHFSSDIKKLLLNSDWLPKGFDIVRLEVSTNKLLLKEHKQLTVVGTETDRKIAKLNSTSWCAGAYLLSKACAKKLINVDPKLYQAVDAMIFSYEHSPLPKQLAIYQIFPAIAIQDKFSSTLSSSVVKQEGFKSRIEENNLEYMLYSLSVFVKKFSFNTIKKAFQGYQRVYFKN